MNRFVSKIWHMTKSRGISAVILLLDARDKGESNRYGNKEKYGQKSDANALFMINIKCLFLANSVIWRNEVHARQSWSLTLLLIAS